jgi:RHS repeat-associated protein
MHLRSLLRTFLLFLCAVLARNSLAQVGNDNPGGVTAEYNGSIATAGHYDPYTGNAKREIDDIVVPGSIGGYPLKFTRALDTRGAGGLNMFGEGGGWSHSYSWSLWIRPSDENPGNDGGYTGPLGGLGYPEGAHADLWTPDDPSEFIDNVNGRHGPSDIFVNNGDGTYELHRADGGKVLFNGYRASAIIDPYLQTTTLAYDSHGRLWKVTEPGGRYLEFFYQTFSYTTQTNPPMTTSEDVISMVQANDGRGNIIETVTYEYEWVTITYDAMTSRMYNLKTVSYDDGSHASYTYERANTDYSASGTYFQSAQVVHTCDDPRYAGPMKQIQYDYVQLGEAAPGVMGRGEIKAEKNVYGQIVSQTTYPIRFNDPTYRQRTETRGDGPTRFFNYLGGIGPEYSFIWTDFKNQPFTDSPTVTGWTITDPLQRTTTYEVEPTLGALKKITHPGDGTTKEYTFSDPGNPYYHSGEKDENSNWITFERAEQNPVTHRVTKITYPDTSTEEFTYNGFGQVLTHKLRTGGTENFRYDSRGLKTLSWPPATESDPNPEQHPTRYLYYTSGPNTDRLYTVIDPRNNATAYEYNQRGQVTKVQHQDGTYTQSHYNQDGTLDWTADENHPGAATDENQRTRYTYDEYKRVRFVTNPMGETTERWYGLDSNWQNPLLHTTNSPKWTKSPMLKNVVYEYDANFRKTFEGVALGTADAAATSFAYDEVGNLIKTTDPRSKETRYGYDARNRRTSLTNALNQTSYFGYDNVGNKTSEIRPDTAFRSWDYDSVNRLSRAIDWRMSTAEPVVATTYTYELPHTENGQTLVTEHIFDGKNADYKFDYDALHRKTRETYPIDATLTVRTETWAYDASGNLRLYKNPAGQYKHLDYADSYDSRNRLRHAGWNTSSVASSAPDFNVGPETRAEFDSASRMTQLTTNGGQTVVAYGYDAANRQIWEEQTLAGYPTRHIETLRDADGNRSDLYLPGYYLLYYDYTQRNQLAHIRDGNNNPAWTYTYDIAGNVTNRLGQWIYANGVNHAYDDLNRTTQIEQGNASIVFARSHYQYDNVGREVATWRDGPQDDPGSKGERFWYATNNEVTTAWYKASNVWTASPSSPATWRGYTYTPDKLNWSSVNDNGYNAPFAANALNQYTSVNGSTPQYDNRFNLHFFSGSQYDHDAASRLTSVSGNGHSASFTYDGLGRCVRRTVDNETRIFAYDGWNPICEWDGAGNWKAVNIYGPGSDEILGRYDAVRGPLIYKQDKQGNITFILDANNQIAEKYTYDAYGTPTILSTNNSQLSTSAIGNRFMYTGREWLSELGIYDYRHRYYLPSIGRFLQTDPTGFDAGDMNLFRYCGDDPVDRTDPTGLFGRRPGEWTDEEWKKIKMNQDKAIDIAQRGKDAIDHARDHPDDKSSKSAIEAFKKTFGPATAENMAKISNDLAKKLAALRDDGTHGYWVHPTNDAKIAALGKDPNRVPAYTYRGDKNIWVNVQHRPGWSNYVLTWAIDHEAGHSAALLWDRAYSTDPWRWNAISNRLRLQNADSSTYFVHQISP